MRDIRQTVWYWREREEGILMLLESHALLYNMYVVLYNIMRQERLGRE